MTPKNPLAAASLVLAFASLPLVGHAQFAFDITGTDNSAKTLTSASPNTATGRVQATGTLSISGSTTAVNITGNGTAVVENYGSILQTGSGRAIDNTGGANAGTRIINNYAGALIRTANADVIRINIAGSNVTLNNSGTIRSLNSSAGGQSSARLECHHHGQQCGEQLQHWPH